MLYQNLQSFFQQGKDKTEYIKLACKYKQRINLKRSFGFNHRAKYAIFLETNRTTIQTIKTFFFYKQKCDIDFLKNVQYLTIATYAVATYIRVYRINNVKITPAQS